jgi:periplasmic divalent cation tolerance protein
LSAIAKEVFMAATLLYVTAPSHSEAVRIGRTLVEERLAACANAFAGSTSIYRWEGAMQEETEAILVAKTRSELVGAASDRIKALHPYECPCVLAFAVVGGYQGFLDWIAEETKD